MWAMSSASAPASATGLADDQRDAVIHTEDLTKIYPGTDFAAVDRLNLDVEGGEIFGLLGPNGAGKTTTAGMLTTRVVPTSGKAYLGGIDVAAHPALAKQLSGIVSQQNTLDRQLTGGDTPVHRDHGVPEMVRGNPERGHHGGQAVPPAWTEQLAIGGRIVAPTVMPNGQQALVVMEKTAREMKQSVLEAVHFVPLKSGIA